ncbi:hypothetical protein G195_001100 [Phytophthora kernoviae 00238/432]|uniref:Uncharacterized protein n=1 Tax=Phytophthora kernoviae 00238/432 TaxID=1284355 RepID=A0A8J4ST13_9STRA|nr:hypothetical protein G195_001100 [Phytophthora kernoviae 00238/432]
MGVFLDMRSSMNSGTVGQPGLSLGPSPEAFGSIGLQTLGVPNPIITLNGTVGVTGEEGDTFVVELVRGSVYDPFFVIYRAEGTVGQNGGAEFHSFTAQDLSAPPALEIGAAFQNNVVGFAEVNGDFACKCCCPLRKYNRVHATGEESYIEGILIRLNPLQCFLHLIPAVEGQRSCNIQMIRLLNKHGPQLLNLPGNEQYTLASKHIPEAGHLCEFPIDTGMASQCRRDAEMREHDVGQLSFEMLRGFDGTVPVWKNAYDIRALQGSGNLIPELQIG